MEDFQKFTIKRKTTNLIVAQQILRSLENTQLLRMKTLASSKAQLLPLATILNFLATKVINLISSRRLSSEHPTSTSSPSQQMLLATAPVMTIILALRLLSLGQADLKVSRPLLRSNPHRLKQSFPRSKHEPKMEAVNKSQMIRKSLNLNPARSSRLKKILQYLQP